MALYEHTVMTRQDISAQQAEALNDTIKALIEENGGSVAKIEYWGLRNLTYRINKNRKGHYAFLKSDAPAAAVQEMERLMRLHDDVMRVLTIKVDTHAEGPSVQMQKRDDRERGERGDRPEGERRERSFDRGGDRGAAGDRRR